MNDIAGIPYSTAEFSEAGKRIQGPEVPADAQEIIIVSHGWNNSRDDAEDLYRRLFTNVREVDAGSVAQAAIVGLIWPSKRFDFPDRASGAAAQGAVRAAATGGASAQERQQLMERDFKQFQEVFKGSVHEAELGPLHDLLARLDDPEAQREFVTRLRRMVQAPDLQSDLDASDYFFGAGDPRDVFVNAMQESADVGEGGQGAQEVAGAGVAFDTAFGRIANAAESLLNITTYYEMKARAGTVGALGLAPLIDELAERETVRHIHLVGHSFGARLVTAAAMHSSTPKLHSMTLLQAAFSHNGFSRTGYFRKVVTDKRVAGPIIITHSSKDDYVGKAYAIASRISRDAASGVGGPQDKYGGLGRNGAVNMGPDEVSPAARAMLNAGQAYELQNQRIHNLEASAYIKDHGDVAGKEVAWAISRAIASAAR